MEKARRRVHHNGEGKREGASDWRRKEGGCIKMEKETRRVQQNGEGKKEGASEWPRPT